MSKVDDVLVGVTASGFDTAPLIYFVERHPIYGDIVRDFIRPRYWSDGGIQLDGDLNRGAYPAKAER